ncbi:MAG: hypothetical protein M3P06_11395 [Acidobacteriota bacterium]|nr:hypothetical protein [Acidobacteriota bacterium]
MAKMMQELRFAKGIDPVADAFEGTVTSDVYSLRGYKRILFVVYVGVGTTGTSTLTVEACDNVTPSTATAIPFWSRTVAASTDVEGAITRRAAAGFATTAGSSKIVLCEADAADCAALGFEFIRLKAVQVVDSAVLGGVMAILGGQIRYAEDINDTVIA